MNSELYEKHKKQIYGIVHKTAAKWAGVSRDELASEAYVAFCKALNTYDPDKAAFSTHLQWTVFGKLAGICKSEHRQRIRNTGGAMIQERPARYTDFCRVLEEREILARLSPDASELLRNMLNSQVQPATKNGRVSLERVYEVFGRVRGWTYRYTERVWAELGSAYEAMAV